MSESVNEKLQCMIKIIPNFNMMIFLNQANNFQGVM